MTDQYAADFSSYLYRQSGNVEIVPWCLYDTQVFRAFETRTLEFFTGVDISSRPPVWSNMYLPDMLPNPQAFLVRSIVIYGITSRLALGAFEFHIGAKVYQHSPAWLMTLRPKWNLNPPLLIPTAMHFRARLEWEQSLDLGAGLDGVPKIYAPVQVALLGQLARPIQ